MNIEALREYCLLKPGTTEEFPFDEDTLVFKVAGKIFALTSLTDWERGEPTVNLKCDPERAVELRERYSEVKPGFHMNKKHWNTVSLNESLADTAVRELIDHSYELVVSKLPVRLRKNL